MPVRSRQLLPCCARPARTRTRLTATRQADDHDTYFSVYYSAEAKHLRAFLARIDTHALIATANHLRDNVPCTLPAVRHNQAGASIDWKRVVRGGQNCHLDIRFADGTVWIARMRLDNPTLPPREVQERIFTCEVDTLRFLAQTRIPAPNVFYHTLDRGIIGTPFMLTEKLPGKALEWSRCTARQKRKVMQQLVEVFLELEKYPLHAAGWLSSDGVGPFAHDRMFSTPSQAIGPFSTLERALTSISDHEIGLINGGELGILAIDNYLTDLWRIVHVPHLVGDLPDRCFYLKHFEDKGDHILVDKHHNITGIIDWEWASAESQPAAFSSPCMMWPVATFYQGSNQLSPEEVEFAGLYRQHGREDMAQFILEGRKHQRFCFFLGGAVPTQREEFEALFQGLREAVEGDYINSYVDWRQGAMARALENDPVFRRLVHAMTAPTPD